MGGSRLKGAGQGMRGSEARASWRGPGEGGGGHGTILGHGGGRWKGEGAPRRGETGRGSARAAGGGGSGDSSLGVVVWAQAWAGSVPMNVSMQSRKTGQALPLVGQGAGLWTAGLAPGSPAK